LFYLSINLLLSYDNIHIIIIQLFNECRNWHTVLYEECFHLNHIETYFQSKEFSSLYIIFETEIKYFMIIRKMQIKNKCSGIVFGLALNHSLNLIQVDPRKLRKTLLISWFIYYRVFDVYGWKSYRESSLY